MTIFLDDFLLWHFQGREGYRSAGRISPSNKDRRNERSA